LRHAAGAQGRSATDRDGTQAARENLCLGRHANDDSQPNHATIHKKIQGFCAPFIARSLLIPEDFLLANAFDQKITPLVVK
jgi:hypothetical protein